MCCRMPTTSDPDDVVETMEADEVNLYSITAIVLTKVRCVDPVSIKDKCGSTKNRGPSNLTMNKAASGCPYMRLQCAH